MRQFRGDSIRPVEGMLLSTNVNGGVMLGARDTNDRQTV